MANIRRISKKYYLRQIVACFMVYLMLFGLPAQVVLAVNPPATNALPSGGTVPVGYGSANFTYNPGNNLTIGSLATQTVINWDNFDIGSLSTVNFSDFANYAVLNRVTGNTGPTGIYGGLSANGTIFVINTRGIVFGPTSYIQAKNFVASGIDIKNDAFMNSIYQFETNVENPYGNVIGDVTNEGIGIGKGILAENVALIGKNVANKGVITTASNGVVVMAAGESVYLSEIGSNVVVNVAMTNPADHVVDNGGDVGGGPGTGPGTITATDGKVILAAGDIYSAAISGIESLAAEAKKDITLKGTITTTTGDVTLVADGDVDIDLGVNSGGNFTSSGVNFDNTGGDIITGGGDLAINHTGTVTLGADLDSGGGSMSGTSTSISVASNAAEIQDAIDIAATDATVSVSGAITNTYNEDLTITTDGLELTSATGNAADVTIKGEAISSGSFPLAVPNIEILANNVEIHDLTIESPDVDNGEYSSGIVLNGTGIQIHDNKFVSKSINDTGTDDGFSIVIQTYRDNVLGFNSDISGLEIKGNTFEGTPGGGYVGAFINHTLTGSGTVTVGGPNPGDENVFTGNVVQGVVTERSNTTIQNNNISTDLSSNSYGIIAMDWGPLGDKVDPRALDNVNITGNTISDFVSGYGMIIGTSGQTLTNISVTDNTVQNNDVGVWVRASAGGVLVNNNAIIGNTTYGVKNTNTGVDLDATANWWGAADGPKEAGPGTGDAVSDDVDYSPWWGGNYVGDPHSSSWTFWTNDSIQAAIDMASSGDRVNVVADSYPGNVNVNKQLDGLYFMGDGTVVSEIEDTLTLLNNDNWDGGVLGIYTESTGADFDLILNTVTDTGEHSLTLDTGTGWTKLWENVTVNGDLTLMSDTRVLADKTLYAGEDVILTAGKRILGLGALTIMADDGDIMLGVGDPLDPETGSGGGLSAFGHLSLDAGDSIYAHGELATAGGNIDLYSSNNTTHLYGNVTADVTDPLSDIIIHNRSEVADGVTLTAGDDVTILELMEAQGDLTIVATGGVIEAADVFMTVDDSLLTLTQNDGLDMEQAFDDVINSTNTNLFATSTAGSVTSSKADRWQTIKAVAHTFISLNDSDTGGNITTKALTAGTDILITSDLGKVYANGLITAGQDVKITAKNEGPDGSENAIFLQTYTDDEVEFPISIVAGRDIWLNNNTLANDGVSLYAGQDVRLGWQGDQDPWDPDNGHYDPKTLTGAGALTVEADRHITLGGDVVAAATVPGNLILKADADNPVDPTGTMHAMGTISTVEAGNVSIYGSELVDLDGIDEISGDSVTVANGGLDIHGPVDAEGHLRTWGGPILIDGVANLAGDVISLGSGIIFEDDVIADAEDDPDTVGVDEGEQTFDAGSGELWAKATITKILGSDLTLEGDVVNLDGEVDIQTGSLTINADTKASLNANITTLKNQTYNAVVELTNNVIAESTDSGNIDFQYTVDGIADGGQGLIVNTAGVTTFQGAIGGSYPLASLVTDAAGHTVINSGTINLNGASALFGDPVLLTNDLTINEAGAGNIEFADTVDSAVSSNYGLLVNSSAGATIFGGAVGSGSLTGSEPTGLSYVHTNAAGTTQINGGEVTTTVYQYYGDPVTLGASTILNGPIVRFYNTLNSDAIPTPRTLLVNSNNVTLFDKTVGGIAPLASLETDAPGITQIYGGLVTTTGAQTYWDPVTLGADTILNGTNVTFANTLNSDSVTDRSLRVNDDGVTTFGDVVGGDNELRHLETDSAGRTEIGAVTINLKGTSALFNDPVLLTDDLTINEYGVGSAGNIEFASTVDSEDSHNYWLVVNSAGATIFGDAVGSGSLAGSDGDGLGSVTTDSAGSTEINGGLVTTTGAQTYWDPVRLGADTTLNGTNVKFDKTLNSDSGNKRSLLVNASGVTTFNGKVGYFDRLSRLETDADVGGTDRTEIGAGMIQLDGASAKFGDPVLLTDNLAIYEYGGGDIEFADTVDSEDGHNYGLWVYNSGATIFNGAVGSDALDSLSQDTGLDFVWTNDDGTTQINGGEVTTTGDQTYRDPVTLGADTTLNGTNVNFVNTLDSDSGNKRSLLVNASGWTTFKDVVGGIDRLSRLETDAGGQTEIGAGYIYLDGASAKFGDPVLLTDNLLIDEDGAGDIEFAGTVDSKVGYNYGLGVESGAGATIFNGAVGSDALGGLSQNTGLGFVWTNDKGSTQINGGLVTTTGKQTYWNPVTLGADTTLNGTDVKFDKTLNSDSGYKRSLLVNASGVTTFNGVVGGDDRLSRLETDADVGGTDRTEIGAGTIKLDGASAKFGDPVLLTNGLYIYEYGAGAVEFADTVDSAEGSNYQLAVISSGGGATIFNGAVGSDALVDLSDDEGLGAVWTDASGTTQINGGIVKTTDYQTYNDPVTLGAGTTLNGTNVTFGNTLDSQTADRTLLVNDSGITKFQDEVGGIDALASLTTDSPGSTELWNNVTTTGTQTYNDYVDLMGDVTAESTLDATIKFAKTVDGGHNLIVNTAGNTQFFGNVGSDEPLTTLTTDVGGTTYVKGDVTTTSGIHFGDDVIADGTGSALPQTLDAGDGILDADGYIHKTTAGNLNLAGGAGIKLGGDVRGTGAFRAQDTVTFENDVTADGYYQRFDAGPGTLDADGYIHKTTAGNLTLGGTTGILLAGDVINYAPGGWWLIFEDAVTADGGTSQRFDASDGGAWQYGNLRALQDIEKTGQGNLTIDGRRIELYGDVDVLTAGGSLAIGSDYDDTAEAEDRGTYDITLYGNLTANQNVTLTGQEQQFYGSDHQTVIATNGKVSVLDNSNLAGGYVEKYSEGGGDLYIYGGSDELAVDIKLPINVYDYGNLWLIGNGDIQVSGDLSAAEDYYSEGGFGGVAIISENGSIYTEGSDALNVSVTGASDHLDGIGVYHLEVDEQTGEPTFYEGDDGDDGDELIPRAAIVIISKEDLKLGPDSALMAYGNYIPLHVIDLDGITSFEDLENYWDELYNEFGYVIEDLYDGFEGYLIGNDYDEDVFDDIPLLKELLGDYLAGLDDRPAIGFLADPLTSIGGIIRDEGDPIDVAIYLASTEGDVDVQMSIEVDIWAGEGVEILGVEPSIYVAPGGTVVVDAYDTVTFGDSGLKINLYDVEIDDIDDLEWFLEDLFYELYDEFGIEIDEEAFRNAGEAYFAALGYVEDSFDPAFIGHLENFMGDYLEDQAVQFTEDGRLIDRLEVCSRLTEWLFQASIYGTLPYPYNPEIVEAFIGGDYILRGAGLGNLLITDGRAWVLVDPIPPAPLYWEAGEDAEDQDIAEGGCPPLMNWLANEIGVPAEDIQVVVANTLALNTDIQPCEMCARLLDASKTLQDAEGTRIAALTQVINQFVTTPAPPSPEQMTQIAVAFSEHVGDGTYYALAGEWIDAVVAYVGIMNTEMGYSAADSVAFAEKYLTPITDVGNVTLTAYVTARLAALGG